MAGRLSKQQFVATKIFSFSSFTRIFGEKQAFLSGHFVMTGRAQGSIMPRIAVVFDVVDEDLMSVYPVTAYETEP